MARWMARALCKSASERDRFTYISFRRGPRTLCNACGLRAFRRKQRENREQGIAESKTKFENVIVGPPSRTLASQQQHQQHQTAPPPPQQTQEQAKEMSPNQRMSVAFLVS